MFEAFVGLFKGDNTGKAVVRSMKQQSSITDQINQFNNLKMKN